MKTRNFKEYRNEHNGVTWKQYVDLRFEEMEKAITVAAKEMNRRLEGMNEIRSQLDRQAAAFQTRDVADAIVQRLSDRINTNERNIGAEAAKLKAYVFIVSAAISIAIGLSVYFLTGR